jgi:hypothetical protein
VRRWASERGLIDENEGVRPQDYDDVHLLEFQPKIKITSPLPNQPYPPDQKIIVKIQYEGHFPLGQLDVFANDVYLGSVKQTPFEFALTPLMLESPREENDLRVVVYDSVRNKTEARSTFKLSD